MNNFSLDMVREADNNNSLMIGDRLRPSMEFGTGD